MRALLLRDGRLNWNFIAPVCVTFFVLHFVGGVATVVNLRDRFPGAITDQVVRQSLSWLYMLTPLLWAWALRRAPEGDQVRAVVYATLAISVVPVIYVTASYILITPTRASDADWKNMAVMLAAGLGQALIMVLIGELLFDHVRNKIVVYISGSVLGSFFFSATTTLLFLDSKLFLVAFLFTSFQGGCVTYAFILLVMKWRGTPLPIAPREGQPSREALRARLVELIKHSPEPEVVLPAMQQEFPEVSFREIVREYKAGADPEIQSRYNLQNWVLIGWLVLSGLYAQAMSGGLNLSFSTYSWMRDSMDFGLQLLMFGIILLKIRLAGDMFAFKAYAYKMSALLAAVGILWAINDVMEVGSVLAAANVLVYGLLIGFSLNIAYSVYPRYHLIFRKRNAFEDLRS